MPRATTTEPRWPALLTMLAAGCVYWALPAQLSFGPAWMLLAIIFVLLALIIYTYRRGHHRVTRFLTIIAASLMTIALVTSLILLIKGLPAHRWEPKDLLLSASALWISNILVFALWYWKLDAGGPLGRERSRGHLRSSFLFPQMLRPEGPGDWSPEFMDYLFLAFNTSTAFSPTDTAVLSRWAKFGMIVQSLISLLIVAILAARAVNIF
jgi:hypothetical protein